MQTYEYEKSKLKMMNLSADEYERRIRELAKRLKV
jgi:hypothetical protein